MNMTTMVGGGAIIGIIASSWSYIKMYLTKLVSYVFVTIQINNVNLQMGVFKNIMKHANNIRQRIHI